MAVAPPLNSWGKYTDFGLTALATIGRFVLGPRRGRRHDFLSLEEASPSCGEPPNRGKLRAGEFIEHHPSAILRAIPWSSAPSFAALISWQIGVGNSGRSAILSAANTSRIHRLARKLAGDDRGLCLFYEGRFSEIDVCSFYGVF